MSNLSQMLKQAQDMQAKMEEVQARLEDTLVEGQAGGGLVKITLNGKGIMKRIDVDPSLLEGEEKEVLEDLIVAAHNEAKAMVEDVSKDEMSAVTGGLSLPPGMKLPF